MEREFDAIVIGAGPAGSTFARVFAQFGREVLLIDKRREIGTPVRCGEGLGEGEVVAQGLELPREVFSIEVEGAKIVGPNGKAIIWKDENTKGWILERKMFDKWLVEQAIKKGAKVQAFTRAIDLIKNDGKIVGVRVEKYGKEIYDIYAPLIISAEGMEAHIARKAGFNTVHNLYDVDTCYQYEMQPYDHENLIELYFGNNIAPRGYVWIFPKKDKKANVGIGIGGHLSNWEKRGKIKGAQPKLLLDKFIENNEKLKESNVLLEFGGVICVGAPLDKFVDDNFMVIGTAAKQVDPIHGGGIAMAMEAGLIAANVANKAFEKRDFSKSVLYEYEKIWRENTGKMVEKKLILRKVMENLSDDDLNHIFNVLTPSEIDKVMRGQFLEVVTKILVGRPQLVNLLNPLRMMQ